MVDLGKSVALINLPTQLTYTSASAYQCQDTHTYTKCLLSLDQKCIDFGECIYGFCILGRQINQLYYGQIKMQINLYFIRKQFQQSSKASDVSMKSMNYMSFKSCPKSWPCPMFCAAIMKEFIEIGAVCGHYYP